MKLISSAEGGSAYGGKLLVIMLLLLMMVCGLGSTSQADQPDKLSYQGKLTDAAGNPLNGTVKVIFRIYDASSGGNKLWEEIYDPAMTGSRGVTVTRGIFSEQLGSLNNGAGTYPQLKNIPFTQKCWLAIQVGSDNEMQRQELSAAAYALKADNVTGVVAIANGGTGQTSANSSLNAMLPSQTGNANKILMTDGANTQWISPYPNMQVFTTSGTFAKPAGVNKVLVEVVGGGAGGCGWAGAGGTIGGNSGGDSSFGSFCSAGGGNGSSGGSATNGDLNISGQNGQGGCGPSSPSGTGGGGAGGSNKYGQGGQSIFSVGYSKIDGNNATGYGGGGGGAYGGPAGGGAGGYCCKVCTLTGDVLVNVGTGGAGGNSYNFAKGGNGSPGLVIVRW